MVTEVGTSLFSKARDSSMQNRNLKETADSLALLRRLGLKSNDSYLVERAVIISRRLLLKRADVSATKVLFRWRMIIRQPRRLCVGIPRLDLGKLGFKVPHEVV
jgi:hypothetical protein